MYFVYSYLPIHTIKTAKHVHKNNYYTIINASNLISNIVLGILIMSYLVFCC